MEEKEQESTITYTKSDTPFNIKKIIAWAVLLVVIVLIIVLIVVIINTVRRNRDERERNTIPIEQEEEKKEDIVLPTPEEEEKEEVRPSVDTDMVAFIEEYKQDVSSANAKYIDKEIETFGYIQNMTTSMVDGSPFISIIPAKTDNIYLEERIQCFVSSVDIFDSFKVEDGVIVKGIVQAFEFGFIPFESCSVRK